MPRITKEQLKERKIWFSEWQKNRDIKLETWFSELSPAIKNKLDFSIDSLSEIEALMLATFDSSEAFKNKSNTSVFDLFGTYIGETYKKNHCIEMFWDCDFSNLESDSHVSFFPFLTSNYTNCSHVINMAYILHNRTSDKILNQYKFAEARFQQAKDNNRIKNNSSIIEDKGYSYQFFLFNDSMTFKEIETAIKQYALNKNLTVATKAGEHIILQFKDTYCFHLHFDDSSSVETEAKEIAKQFSEIIKEIISNCKSRFEFWGDEDLNADFMNESMLLLEFLRKEKNMLVYDFKKGKFFNQ